MSSVPSIVRHDGRGTAGATSLSARSAAGFTCINNAFVEGVSNGHDVSSTRIAFGKRTAQFAPALSARIFNCSNMLRYERWIAYGDICPLQCLIQLPLMRAWSRLKAVCLNRYFIGGRRVSRRVRFRAEFSAPADLLRGLSQRKLRFADRHRAAATTFVSSCCWASAVGCLHYDAGEFRGCIAMTSVSRWPPAL